MSGLIEFLLARISEDEALANAAITGESLRPYGDKNIPLRRPEDVPEDVIGYLGGTWGNHFARWAPLRVLAECAAKRAMIADLANAWEGSCCTECNEAAYLADRLLRVLAAPFQSHPDFDASWGVL